MHTSLWSGLAHTKTFDCQDLDVESSPPRIMVVTEVAILLLEPNIEHPEYAHLYSWANFQSIERITKSRQDLDRLTFHWKAIGEAPACKQTLSVPESNACLEVINDNMQRLGITEESRQYIAEEEVTATALSKVHISDVLQEVEMYEGYVKVRETPETISKLLGLYQQVIEYYSAKGDDRFAEYLEKMRALFRKENEETEV